jgi:hypothetical protein
MQGARQEENHVGLMSIAPSERITTALARSIGAAVCTNFRSCHMVGGGMR